MALFGRSWESAQLTRLVASSADGQGAALVLHGEVGSGKSAMLTLGARLATAAMVLRIQPTSADPRTPYDALRQLRGGRPETDAAWARLDDLVAERADAERADPVEVGATVLGALRVLTRDRPVVLLVDDADALDERTLHSLRFVADRVSPLAALVLFTETTTVPRLEGLDRLELPRLPHDDAAALLGESRPGLTDPERAGIIALAVGNPQALKTLPVPSPGAQLAALDLGEPLQAAFRRRMRALPSDVRSAVILVALAGEVPVDVLERVRTVLTAHPVSAIRATGWVRVVGDRARMVSPLTRALVLAELTPGERNAAASAFLASAPEEAVPALRARMRAVLATPPDDSVADALDAAADEATAAARWQDAIELRIEAARLSGSVRGAADRLLAAGSMEWLRGRFPAARELDVRARTVAGGARSPARERLAALLEMVAGDCATADALFARSVEGRSDDALVGEAASWLTAAWRAGGVDPLTVARERDLPDRLPAPFRRAVLRVLDAWRAGGAPAVGAEPELWAVPPAVLAVAWGVQDGAAQQYATFINASRARGAATLVAIALAERAFLDAMAGRIPEAAAAASESLALASEIGARVTVGHALLAQSWVSALRGDRAQTEALAERAAAAARSTGNRAVLGLVRWHRGAAALFTGSTDAVVDLLAPLADPRSESHHPTAALFAALDLGEAAARRGEAELARRQQRMLEEASALTGAAWSSATAEFLSAMLADGDAAERALHAVRSALIGEPGPFLRARVELVLGERLRRARRSQDARAFLTNAADEFDALGAASLAARARESLGLLLQPRSSSATGGHALLTAQESRIAALAAEGASNKAIAAQLFISPRTVGHHLSAIYRKLEVASRSGLAGVLQEAAGA